MAAASIAVAAPRSAIMIADEEPVGGPCLDRHLDAGPHRRLNLLVGARIGRPGVAAAAEQLEAASVDVEQHRRALPLLAAQPDVELAAAVARRPVADRGEGMPALRRRRLERLGDRIAAAIALKRAPRSENAERVRLRGHRRSHRDEKEQEISRS